MIAAPAKRMLSKEEAAQYCGFPSVARFLAHVRIEPVNYGNCVRFDKNRLDEWLDTLSQSDATRGQDIVGALFNESPRDRRSRVQG